MNVTEASPPAGAQPSQPSRFAIFGAITIGLLVLNTALLLTGSDPPPMGVPVFYWQRFNTLLYPLRFFGVIAAPICVFFWAVTFIGRRPKRMSCVTLFMAACVAVAGLGANVVAIYVGHFGSNLDSISFQGKTYELAEFTRGSEAFAPVDLYLGDCDLFGVRCIFQEIYGYNYCPGECAPHFAVSRNGQMIDVQIDHKPVYSFDRFGGHCTLPKGAIDYSGGYCYYP